MNQSTSIFLRLCTIVVVTLSCFVLLKNDWIYTTLFVFIFLIVLAVELYQFVQNSFLFYDKTIQAILQNDFSAAFSNTYFHKNYDSLIALYEKLKTQQNEHLSKELVYHSILNTMETGILILKKDKAEWTIFLMNDYFSSHFQVPKVSQWHYLKNQFPALCTLIEEQNFEDIKTSLSIRVNQEESQTFVMQSSRSTIYEHDYYIVLLNSVQSLIEKKEKEAWINLMKVISHELLNSITPIRSLSQNLHDMTQQEALSEEDLEDLKQSLSTILKRTDHLQQFVESYRKLAMLPSPKKQKVALTDWIENGMKLMQPLLDQDGITLINKVNFNRWLWIDPQQMEQVLINLLLNSKFALAEATKKEIIISAEAKEKRVFITISDTGHGIEKEIEDKLFLPFFTTRKSGAGIGLTLSKSIVEAHGGYLFFQKHQENTRFMICLTL